MSKQRIQYTPTTAAEIAITFYIADVYKDKKLRISRTDALNHFVERGIEDWQRDNLAKQAMNQSKQQMDAQEAGK